MSSKNIKSFVPKVEESGYKGPRINPTRPPMPKLADNKSTNNKG